MIMEKMADVAKISEENPPRKPRERVRAVTRAEWALGMPPAEKKYRQRSPFFFTE